MSILFLLCYSNWPIFLLSLSLILMTQISKLHSTVIIQGMEINT